MGGKHVLHSDIHSREFVGVSVPEEKVQCNAHSNSTTRPIRARRVVLESYSWELFVVREGRNRKVSGAKGLPHSPMYFGVHSKGRVCEIL